MRVHLCPSRLMPQHCPRAPVDGVARDEEGEGEAVLLILGRGAGVRGEGDDDEADGEEEGKRTRRWCGEGVAVCAVGAGVILEGPA